MWLLFSCLVSHLLEFGDSQRPLRCRSPQRASCWTIFEGLMVVKGCDRSIHRKKYKRFVTRSTTYPRISPGFVLGLRIVQECGTAWAHKWRVNCGKTSPISIGRTGGRRPTAANPAGRQWCNGRLKGGDGSKWLRSICQAFLNCMGKPDKFLSEDRFWDAMSMFFQGPWHAFWYRKVGKHNKHLGPSRYDLGFHYAEMWGCLLYLNDPKPTLSTLHLVEGGPELPTCVFVQWATGCWRFWKKMEFRTMSICAPFVQINISCGPTWWRARRIISICTGAAISRIQHAGRPGICATCAAPKLWAGWVSGGFDLGSNTRYTRGLIVVISQNWWKKLEEPPEPPFFERERERERVFSRTTP